MSQQAILAEEKAHPGSYLFSFAVTCFVFALLTGRSRFWTDDGFIWLPAGSMALLPSGLLFLAALMRTGWNPKKLRLDPFACTAGVVLVFFTDWLARPYALLRAPAIRGEILMGAAASWFMLRKHPRLFGWLAPAAILLLLASFFIETGGRLLFSDDHSSFFYRLALLRETFPHIPFFNPFWNGGVESREFFPSGSLNAFFLGAPILYLFDPERAYNLVIAFLLFIVTPGAAYLAARVEGLPRFTASLAGLLAITCGLPWYRWALSYGTVGFITSSALIPLVIVLSGKILSADRQLSLPEFLLAFASISLMLFWSLSGIVILPLIVLALASLKRVLKKRFIVLLIILLAAANTPWIVIFWQASNVGQFMKAEKAPISAPAIDRRSGELIKESAEKALVQRRHRYRHRPGKIEVRKAVDGLRDKAVGANPLLTFLALAGIFGLSRSSRWAFGLTAAWLLFLGSAGVPLKPQLELDRMLVVLTLTLSLPGALAISEVLLRANESRRRMLAAALVGGFLFASPLSTGAILRNRTVEQFRVKEAALDNLIEAIKTKTPPGGRIFFSGCLVHEINGGHAAPLVVLTGRPLMASSYQHDIWWYIQLVPPEYMERGPDGIEDYLSLYNVSVVAAHEPEWQKKFNTQPERYQLIWKNSQFQLYQRLQWSDDYFYEGQGKLLSQDFTSVTVSLDTPHAVIKYNYLPFLTSSACKISPKEISAHVRLIQLDDCPTGTAVRIQALGPVRRFFIGE